MNGKSDCMLHNYLSHFIRNLIAYRNMFNLRLFSLPHASTLDLHPKSTIIWSNRFFLKCNSDSTFL